MLFPHVVNTDKDGIPTDAFVYSDAMTESKGNTQVVNRQSKQAKYIKNRLFAAEVICGPVDLMLYVSVDNTMAGGANLAIEIHRLALEYLSKELENTSYVCLENFTSNSITAEKQGNYLETSYLIMI